MKESFLIHFNYKEARNKLRKALDKVEKETKIKNLANNLEFILGELTKNAIHANLKRIFFASKGYSYNTLELYQEGNKVFIEQFAHINAEHYSKAFKLLDMKMEIQLDLLKDHLMVKLQNKNAMSQAEEKLLRENFSHIMANNSEDISNLYIHFGNRKSNEDELSLALVIDLIRKMGFDPKHFRIYNEEDQSIARLEFSLSQAYTYIREKVSL